VKTDLAAVLLIANGGGVTTCEDTQDIDIYFKYNDREIFTGQDMMNIVYKKIGKD